MLLFSTLPLRRKVPLVVAGLTTGALLVGATLAYLEVRRAALTTAEARLSSIVSELESLTSANQVQRLGMERRIVESALVRGALEGAPLDTAALFELVDSLRVPLEEGLPFAILRPDGSTAFSTGSVPKDPDPEPPRDAARAYGPLRSVGGRTLYWVSIPVPGPTAEPMGWVVHRRQIGDPASGSTFARLLGSDIRVLLGTLSDSVWVDIAGPVINVPPDAVRVGEPYRSATPDGAETLAMARPLTQSPWVVQADIPMARVMARPHAFRNSALGTGSLLVLLTVFLGWRAGRTVAEPLEDLATAADAMTRGDYGRRVEAVGDDEIGHLARAFNAMASHVEDSDEALRLQLEEARALTVRLEEAMLAADRAREEALGASRAKSDFLATLSHEIRTPISAIMGYIDLLVRGVPDEPTDPQRLYLQRIEGANEHLISLVNDLLDFARVESGEVRIDLEAASVRETVAEALATLEPSAARKGVRLTSTCDHRSSFFGDKQRVRQIVLNLVSNAIKFTPAGGSVTVRGCLTEAAPPGVEGSPDRTWARIDVVDDGIGIDPDQVARMFEPFVQGPTRSAAESGTGLGLAISRRLAALMSGALTAESAPGEGSTFTLWLPSAPAGGVEGAEAPSSKRAKAAAT